MGIQALLVLKYSSFKVLFKYANVELGARFVCSHLEFKRSIGRAVYSRKSKVVLKNYVLENYWYQNIRLKILYSDIFNRRIRCSFRLAGFRTETLRRSRRSSYKSKVVLKNLDVQKCYWRQNICLLIYSSDM